jgi:hypothetical protein
MTETLDGLFGPRTTNVTIDERNQRLGIVRDWIKEHPDSLNMASWRTTDPVCGTTMCFAGTAVHLLVPGALFVKHVSDPSPSDIGGVVVTSAVLLPGETEVRLIEEVAQDVLGLSEYETASLFYSGNDDWENVVEDIIEGLTLDAEMEED